MRIIMMTNTYLPFVGGVSHSVSTFADSLRRRGHEVLVIAPEYGQKGEKSRDEDEVVRVPATRMLTKGTFAISLGSQSELIDRIRSIGPDVIHSHHPFLLGDTALRAAAAIDVPLVFTYHTRYEYYTHYLRQKSTTMKRLAVEIATRYCNIADQIVAPSESIERLLTERGVHRPIEVIPTGIDTERFNDGDGIRFRREHCIRNDTFLVGHVGRLAPEKNIRLTAQAAMAFIREHPEALFLLVGSGPEAEAVTAMFAKNGLPHHLLPTGALGGQDLVDAYQAMNVFLFASTTETQGMVLAEAMSAGVPVVGLDAPGVREVIRDGANGRLVHEETPEYLADGLAWAQDRLTGAPEDLRGACLDTAAEFAKDKSVDALEALYSKLKAEHGRSRDVDSGALFSSLAGRIEREWDIWSNRVSAVQALLREEGVDLDEK
ncbi:MAG: glycosyltransferase [bacterium]